MLAFHKTAKYIYLVKNVSALDKRNSLTVNGYRYDIVGIDLVPQKCGVRKQRGFRKRLSRSGS